MSALLLIVLAVTSYFPQPSLEISTPLKTVNQPIQFLNELATFSRIEPNEDLTLNSIRLMLSHSAPNLNSLVINKVLTTLSCATEFNVDHNHILTIIDYSLPSNEKRFWVFDLKEKKMLFHTYVSHGIKSGALISNYFSNKNNSKASSIGVYQTEKSYYGRDGLSLRLEGLDRSFNDNASSRAVVMHSGWYVEESFIKKYGRPGRSWGCPALPLTNSDAIINTIKDKSLLVIYYPSDNWFAKSKFLNCTTSSEPKEGSEATLDIAATPADDQRDAILFVGGYKGNKHAETKPVAVISADKYQKIFHTGAPLSRMLRRQINHEEYLALSAREMNYLVNNNVTADSGINVINFVIPVLKVVRGGYYETQMQFVNLGKIKEIKMNNAGSINDVGASYTVYLEGKSPLNLTANKEFIRWVGL